MSKDKKLSSEAIEIANRDVSEMIRELIRPNLDKCFEDIKSYVESCERDRKIALDKVVEWNKDEEIQKLKEEIYELRYSNNKGVSFVVTEEELEQINAWQEEHIKKYHGGNSYCGAIGGRFHYKFIPTSIGDIGYVYCGSCENNEKISEDEKCFCFRELD